MQIQHPVADTPPVVRRSRAPTKAFLCPIAECGKTFTRGEHLQRHALNHEGGDNTCSRCRAHFKRKDLLDRHLARHREKDEAAGGGEGSGILNTRKRKWKDANGNVVAKRPTKIEATRSADSIPIIPQTQATGQISPPASAQPSENNTYSSESCRSLEDPAKLADFHNLGFDNNLVFADLAPQTQDFMQSGEGFWDFGAGQPYSADNNMQSNSVPWDDVFQPDTASSFNMPFTTMNNYNWLFELDYSQMDQDIVPTVALNEALPDLDPNSFMVPELTALQSNSPPPPIPIQNYQPVLKSATPPVVSLPSPDTTNATTSHLSRQTQPDVRPSTTGNWGDVQGTSGVSPGPSSRNGTYTATSEVPLLAPAPYGISIFPTIDEMSRQQLLDLVDASSPINPDGSVITCDHPLLSLTSLQTFSDLYWCDFNIAYPLLHRATFEPAKAESLLLMSVLLLGASYSSDKEAHQLAVCIHDVLRPLIFSHAAFSAKPELWILQTVLLVECFGKSRAGRKQHDMSHLFHGLLINLIRRSDCQGVTHGSDQKTGDLEDDWQVWSEAEQKRRIAFLCFMWDTQHAVLFCQSLCMSAFELRATLPCDQSLWEASSALSWDELRKRQKAPPLFLTLLKSQMTPGASLLPRHINGLSRVLLLHGLMSISWDMKRRDQTSLGLVNNDARIGDWRVRMGKSYDAWKADFDSYCMNMTQLTQNDNSRRKEVLRFSTAYNAIYHAAHVILNAEFLDLQIYAGARHILGRAVARTDYVRAKRVVQQWIKDEPLLAGKAAWHAAHILRDSIMNLDDFQDIGLFHYPWCLYLANITCWAFHHARPAADASGHGHDGEEDDEIVWDARAEMNALISSMTSTRPEDLAELAGRRGTNGLTAVIAQTLGKVRWAVVHDAMCVLRGLVPWRLINQYEASGVL